jgi:hypothetical protein
MKERIVSRGWEVIVGGIVVEVNAETRKGEAGEEQETRTEKKGIYVSTNVRKEKSLVGRGKGENMCIAARGRVKGKEKEREERETCTRKKEKRKQRPRPIYLLPEPPKLFFFLGPNRFIPPPSPAPPIPSPAPAVKKLASPEADTGGVLPSHSSPSRERSRPWSPSSRVVGLERTIGGGPRREGGRGRGGVVGCEIGV